MDENCNKNNAQELSPGQAVCIDQPTFRRLAGEILITLGLLKSSIRIMARLSPSEVWKMPSMPLSAPSVMRTRSPEENNGWGSKVSLASRDFR